MSRLRRRVATVLIAGMLGAVLPASTALAGDRDRCGNAYHGYASVQAVRGLTQGNQLLGAANTAYARAVCS